MSESIRGLQAARVGFQARRAHGWRPPARQERHAHGRVRDIDSEREQGPRGPDRRPPGRDQEASQALEGGQGRQGQGLQVRSDPASKRVSNAALTPARQILKGGI
eukprot:3355707-Pyramimonas_sp.AAC.1